MKISTYSVICSVVLSSLYLAVICMIRSRMRIQKKPHVTIFLLLYLFGFLRLLLPIDFTFTKGITLKGNFSELWKSLFDDKLFIFRVKLSIMELLCIAILFWSLCRVIFFIGKYCKTMRYFKMLSAIADTEQKSLTEWMQKEFCVRNVQVIKSQMICSPFATGLFRKYIVLPDIPLTDSELHYVLLHECTHIHRKDLFKKMLLQMFYHIFWWIPFHSFLCRDFEQLMEIHCDRDVTASFSAYETAEYMKTFLSVTKKVANTNSRAAFMCFSFHDSKEAVVERFKLMSQENEKLNIKNKSVLLAVMILLMASYAAAPMPHYEFNAKETQTDGDIVSSNNSYLLLKDGKYFLVTDKFPTKELSEEHALIMIAGGIELREE